MGSSDERPRAGSRLVIAIVVSIAAGTAIGGWAPTVGVAVGIFGEIFVSLLTMLVVPLVVLSMVVGVTSLGDIRKLGRLGSRTVGYYLATTAIAVGVGILAVNIVDPGWGCRPARSIRLRRIGSRGTGTRSCCRTRRGSAPATIIGTRSCSWTRGFAGW